MILDGKKTANLLKRTLKATVEKRVEQEGYRPPELAILRVGENPASTTYIKWKRKDADEIGIKTCLFEYPSNQVYLVTALETRIKELSATHACDGIIVQLPIPGLEKEPYYMAKLLNAISQEKDVDGLRSDAFGLLAVGEYASKGFVPCTPHGVMMMLDMYGINPAGKNVVVVGRSNLVGRPLAMMMTNANASVTLLHSKSSEVQLHDATTNADILVLACGQPGKFSIDDIDINRHPTIIDVSTTPVDGKLKGDFNYDYLIENDLMDCINYTPVPGGVGPMTRIALMSHVVEAYERNVQRGFVYKPCDRR